MLIADSLAEGLGTVVSLVHQLLCRGRDQKEILILGDPPYRILSYFQERENNSKETFLQTKKKYFFFSADKFLPIVIYISLVFFQTINFLLARYEKIVWPLVNSMTNFFLSYFRQYRY